MTERLAKPAYVGRGRLAGNSYGGAAFARLAFVVFGLGPGAALAGGYDTGDRDWFFMFQL
jgi:hypothetical protein